ncbi:glycoside hydrolase family 20 zincin-like fold domain-containing protein [Streptomyces sp. LN549]|uniref:glycoside hydrolase family 20 zincin-like fold domain-containing protein n=1 Tax=Streptomyces sp. LN549 TaxID=3112979 RepID=UPI003714EDEF
MNQRKPARRAVLGSFLLAPLLSITGTSPAAAEVNTAPPGVVPALQQWTGGTGSLTLTSSSRIVVPPGAPAALRALATQVAAEAAELTSLRLTAATGTPRAGDISLRIDASADFGSAKTELRPEAYRLTVTRGSVEIVGGGRKGAYYGTRTLLQSLLGSANRDSIPVGTAVDYPNYAVRGFMLDVGRRYFTPEFIKSYLHWMGWLKLNTFQLHLQRQRDPSSGR